jgi:hypothetical protein
MLAKNVAILIGLAQVEDTRENRVTRLETGHGTSHLHHHARQIAAQRGRRMKPQDGLEFSFRDHVIVWIQADGVDLNQNFIQLGRRPWNVGERDLIGPAITFEGNSSSTPVDFAGQIAWDRLPYGG